MAAARARAAVGAGRAEPGARSGAAWDAAESGGSLVMRVILHVFETWASRV